MPDNITQEQLKDLLHYNAKTGVFTWKMRPLSDFASERSGKMWNTRYASTVAGRISPDGYSRIKVWGVEHKAHRLAFLYQTGRFPSQQADHINHIRDDNRWSNLREASHAENSRNQPLPRNNTSGVMGVCWYKRDKKWMAQIKVNGTRIYLGLFGSLPEAAAARAVAERKYNFHPNHGAQT